MWVALVLEPLAEKIATFQELEDLIGKTLKCPHLVFFPSAVLDKKQKLCQARSLIEGYIFVRVSSKETALFDLIETPFIEDILREGKKICRISAAEIKKLRTQVENLVLGTIGVGSHVFIIAGVYKNLAGEVVGVDLPKKLAKVCLTFSSKKVEEWLPFLMLSEEQIPDDDDDY
jgi:transcription antitermination factor NusG